MRRILLALGILLMLPILILGALFTPWGLDAAGALVTRFVPGLTLEGVSGQLPRRLAVARLTMTDADGIWLNVENAEVRLLWRDLAHRRVTLDAVRVARLALHRLPGVPAPPEPAAPLALPTPPRLPVDIEIRRLELSRLDLGAAVLGQPASLSIRGSAAMDNAALTTSLTLQRRDQPGSASLSASLRGDRLTVRLEASEPPGGLVAGLASLTDAPFALRLDVDGPATGAPWRARADLGTAEAEFAGVVALAPDGGLAITLAGHAAPGPLLPEAFLPLASRITLDISLRRPANGALTLERLSFDLPALRGEAQGGLDAREVLSGSFRLQTAGPDLFAAWLPPGLSWNALSAEGHATGFITAPDLTLRILAEGPRGLGEADAMLGPQMRLAARYTNGRVGARLEAERLTATVTGPVTQPFDLAYTIEARDPLATTGTLTAEGHLRGTVEVPALDIRLRADRMEAHGQVLEGLNITASASLAQVSAEAAARFQSRPLNLSLRVTRQGEAVRLDRLEARWAEATLTGHGEGALPAGPFTGALRLDAPDLARLELGLFGRLTTEIEARAIVGATGPAAQGLHLRLNAAGLGTAALRASMQAEAEGDLAALAFRIGVTAPQGGFDLTGNLAMGETSDITLKRFEARSGADALNLSAPARIRVAADGGMVLEPARLASRRGGSLTVQGRMQDGNLNARADLSAVPLAPLSGGMVTGTASGQVIAVGPTATPRIDATLRAEGLRATDPSLAALPSGQLNATARLEGQALRAQARLTAGPGVQLDLEASQPRGLGMEAPFEAALRGRLDLGLLARPYLSAGANRATGRAALDLRASGRPSAPVLTGSVTVSEASYANPLYGTRIDGVAAHLTAQGERLIVESLTGRTAGGGTLSAQGWLEPMREGIPAELQLRANGARPIGGETGDATVDADLLLRGPLLSGGHLGGRVTIRRADLRIPEGLPASVPSLGRIREIGPLPPGRRPQPPLPGPRATPVAPSLPMALDLIIAAPRAVFIRGRGLEAELGGEIILRGTIAAPVPSGGLRLRRGSFDLAGRQLQFSRGVIGFDAGTFLPSLDFLASVQSRAYTINLAIKGNPSAPVLTVTADPELPQDEALARLLFDRETNRLSAFEIVTIAQAAAQLAGISTPGGTTLDRLRRGLGLDRLGVGASARGGAALEAGSYVAPGVYLGIRQGTDGSPGVGVQVELTPRLRLEGQTGTGPAGDRLGVTWEREY